MKQLTPKNENQAKLLEAIHDSTLVVSIGPAGTGKSYVACHAAGEMLVDKTKQQIIITRPNVGVGKTLGSVPGTLDEKLLPWSNQYLQYLKKFIGGNEGAFASRMGKSIVLQSLEHIRGCSFDNAIILVEEAQNLTTSEIKALTTRIGENTTMVLSGDPAQSDKAKGNDLMQFVRMCHRHNIDIPIVEFGVSDIVRSEMVKKLIIMFMEEGI